MVGKLFRHQAVFLDRDGVLNESVPTASGRGRARWNVGELRVLTGHGEALTRLVRDGWLLIVVTNQPDVSRGLVSKETVRELNALIAGFFPGISDFYACFHTATDGCVCRKPKPGMLVQAVEKHKIDTSLSWMVGDRWVDIAAGKAAGCRTILIDSPESWLPTSSGKAPADLTPDFVVADLSEAADVILKGNEAG